MIYLHEIWTVNPSTEEDFWKIVGNDYLPDVERNGMRLVGLCKVGIRYSEDLAIWELDDWAALDRMQEFHAVDPWMSTWKMEAARYRTDWVRKIMEPAPFSPTLAEIKEDDRFKSTIYLYSISRMFPGKVGEYFLSIERELKPRAEEWGLNIVGCYQVVGGEAASNEVIEIWTAGNTNEEYGAIRKNAENDPTLKTWENKVGHLRFYTTNRFLLGLVSFSPLRMKDEFMGAMHLMQGK